MEDKIITKKVELLAPAGSISAMRAAINAGCDAVYLGGTKFGARAYAQNPEADELLRAIDLCHKYSKKIYLTVNTLFKQEELADQLYDFLNPLYMEGLDAVIVQDLGAMKYINDTFKGLDIHVSTQAAVMSDKGADYLKKLIPSITRIVPARELSLPEIRDLSKYGLETEVFVHGALCYCYSGQCLLSSLVGGRSGNRGRCAQPCRKVYDDEYLLSTKDLCTLNDLYQLLYAGVDSLKIEGRMKSPEYVAGVVDAYRRELDHIYRSNLDDYLGDKHREVRINNEKSVLMDIYNRGGFTAGYIGKHNGPDMMSMKRNNHQGILVGNVVKVRGREAIISLCNDISSQDILEIRDDRYDRPIYEFTVKEPTLSGSFISSITMKDKTAHVGDKVWRTRNNSLLLNIRNRFIEVNRKIPVIFSLMAKVGEPLTLTATTDIFGRQVSTTLTSQIVERSSSSPTTVEQIKKQLSKLGETDFILSDLQLFMDDNIFIPVSTINNLRRETIAVLEQRIYAGFYRSSADRNDITYFNENVMLDKAAKPYISCSVYNIEQLEPVISDDRVKVVYYNITSFDAEKCAEVYKRVAERGKVLYIGLPYILRKQYFDDFNGFVLKLTEISSDIGFLCRNAEEISIVSGYTCNIRTDYNVYRMNRLACSVGRYAYTLPVELNCCELCTVSGPDAELIVYGYLPAMFSAQCVYKNKNGVCGRNSIGINSIDITDELGYSFHVLTECNFCLNIIFNSCCIDITNLDTQISNISPGSVRYDFTIESAEDIRYILSGSIKSSDAYHTTSYTNGHFKRGIL